MATLYVLILTIQVIGTAMTPTPTVEAFPTLAACQEAKSQALKFWLLDPHSPGPVCFKDVGPGAKASP